MSLTNEVHRKLLHMTLSIFPVMYLWMPRKTMAMIMAGLVILEWIMEMSRLKVAWVQRWWMNWFETVYREKELHAFTGLFYAMLAFTVSVVFMKREVAVPAMLFLCFGDTASALVRLEGGKKKMKGWVSTAACLGVCLVIGWYFLPPGAAIVGAVVASLIERYSGDSIDDNLVLPLGSGVAMTLVMGG